MRYRTILIPVLNRFRVTPFGNDFSASRAYIDVDVPEFTAILPYTEELQLHTVGESMTNNLKSGLYVQPGFDRDRELGGGPFLIGAVVDSGTSSPLRHTAYTDTSKFQRGPPARPPAPSGLRTGTRRRSPTPSPASTGGSATPRAGTSPGTRWPSSWAWTTSSGTT